jgi:hypothetical protein
MDINSAVGRELGLNDGDIAVILGGGEEGFSDSERLLLRLADTLAATPANVSSSEPPPRRRRTSAPASTAPSTWAATASIA